jgi:hypothetical protein
VSIRLYPADVDPRLLHPFGSCLEDYALDELAAIPSVGDQLVSFRADDSRRYTVLRRVFSVADDATIIALFVEMKAAEPDEFL